MKLRLTIVLEMDLAGTEIENICDLIEAEGELNLTKPDVAEFLESEDVELVSTIGKMFIKEEA